jgi:hypothetical protein
MIISPDGVTARLWGVFIAAAIALWACAKSQTFPATVSSAPPAPAVISNTKSVLPRIAFAIQAGAFQSLPRAERFVRELQAEGLDAYYFEDQGGFIKVRFGRFNTRDQALDHAMALKAKGVIETFYIVQPDRAGSAGAKRSPPDPRVRLEHNLIKTAKRFIGIPYRWGGASVEKGFDCSGLTMTVYRLNGLELPRKAASQFQAGKPVPRHALKTGDLVFFATDGDNRISHVGIFSGNGAFIHAPSRGKRIRVSSLSSVYYKERYRGARRYF